MKAIHTILLLTVLLGCACVKKQMSDVINTEPKNYLYKDFYAGMTVQELQKKLYGELEYLEKHFDTLNYLASRVSKDSPLEQQYYKKLLRNKEYLKAYYWNDENNEEKKDLYIIFTFINYKLYCIEVSLKQSDTFYDLCKNKGREVNYGSSKHYIYIENIEDKIIIHEHSYSKHNSKEYVSQSIVYADNRF